MSKKFKKIKRVILIPSILLFTACSSTRDMCPCKASNELLYDGMLLEIDAYTLPSLNDTSIVASLYTPGEDPLPSSIVIGRYGISNEQEIMNTDKFGYIKWNQDSTKIEMIADRVKLPQGKKIDLTIELITSDGYKRYLKKTDISIE